MRSTTDIALDLIDQGSDTKRPKCRLEFKGAPTQTIIDGAVLEACVECRGLYLLFVTDDIPYEEALYLYLMDGDFRTLDSASLGAPYSTGSFKNLTLRPPATVGFRFIGDTDWTVEILPNAGWRVPLFGDPRGVMHKISFKRHFVVRGDPRPEEIAREV